MKSTATLFLSFVLGIVSVAGGQISAGAQPPFSIKIRLLSEVVKLGSPVTIEVTKTNTSNHDLSSMSESEFSIDVNDKNGSPAPETEAVRRQKEAQKEAQWTRSSGSVMGNPLRPGDSDRRIIGVDRYYDMDQPGKYTIQLRGGLHIDGNDYIVKSNTVTVTVTP